MPGEIAVSEIWVLGHAGDDEGDRDILEMIMDMRYDMDQDS
jgi:hypothetical protein